MCRFDLIKGFITEDERLQFLSWFEASLRDGKNLVDGITKINGRTQDATFRKTTRRNADWSDMDFPPVAYDVFNRIKYLYGYQDKRHQVTNPGYGAKDGMIAVATMPGGDTYLHQDPGEDIVTFNILIQDSGGGGILELNDTDRVCDEGDLHAYNPCLNRHRVSENTGTKNRYMWIYRLHVPVEEWESRERKSA